MLNLPKIMLLEICFRLVFIQVFKKKLLLKTRIIICKKIKDYKLTLTPIE